jgi:hypothetical protein
VVVLDAVVVDRIFGLDFLAIFALIRVFVTLVIIFFTIRIPFKRNYHWMFLIVSIVIVWHSVIWAYLQVATSSADIPIRNFLLDLAKTPVQAVTIFQFVVYFVSRKVSRPMKAILVAGYAFLVAAVWVPDAIDPAFLGNAKWALTQFGWQNGPGTGDVYLRPEGIDIFTAIMGILIFALLFKYYRSQKSDLLRGQTKYLIIGMLIFFIGFFSTSITRFWGGTNYPNTSDLISMVGDFILLLGLMKKGFYSVTPVAETAMAEGPARYPLEDGRSYLSHDQKSAFEGFSELVRNGHEGLLITRIVPAEVRKDYGIQTTPIRWLAEAKGQDTIPPGDLLGLSLTIKDFLEKATKPVVMLQGIEYLTTYNGFTPILRLINGLRESSAATSGILILPVLRDSLNRQDEVLLSSETTPMPMPTAS